MLVDPNENPYSLSGIFAMGSFNPSDTARVVLVDPDGNPYKATGGSGGGATIQVNGVDTSDQTLLNFVDTASVTWANPSGGIVEATATGGGGSGTVTQVNTTAPITGGPITTTGTIGITQASASVNGFLSSTDWNTFNNKQPAGSYLTAVTSNAPLSGSGTAGSHLVISQSGAATDGYLSSTDWNTFNNKQPAGAYLTAVTANVPLSGSGTSGSHLVISQAGAATDGYLSSTDWNTFNNKVGGPAGSSGDIQFNNGGSFGGDSKVIRYTLGGNRTFINADDTVEAGLDISLNQTNSFILSVKNIYGGTNKDFGIANDLLGNYGLLINGDTSQVEIPNHLLVDQTITAMTGLPADFKILYANPVITATDGAPGDAVSSLTSRIEVGPSGQAVQGNFHSVVSDVRIGGSGNDASEYTSWLGLVDVRIGTGYTQSTGPAGRAWGSDWTVQGPIAVQPNLLNGFTQFVGNYYNGSPTASSSGGIWITTAPNGGAAGTEGVRNGATTYPLDVGLGITGASGTVGTPSGLGFTTGIQIGGNGSGWWESGQTRIGTGIDIKDFTTRGIYVHSPLGTPTADIESTGKSIFANANITKIGNLTSNGFVKTGSGDGTLSVDTSTYLTSSTGVTSVAKNGSTQLHGDVTLTGGTNVTLTQSGNDISIAATGGGGSATVTRITNSTNQNLTRDGAYHALSFDTDILNPNGWHNTVTNNSRITFNATVNAQVSACVDYSSSVSGDQIVNIALRLNGTTFIAVGDSHVINAAFGTSDAVLSVAYQFVNNDYIEVMMADSTGSGTGTVNAGSAYSPIFTVFAV